VIQTAQCDLLFEAKGSYEPPSAKKKRNNKKERKETIIFRLVDQESLLCNLRVILWDGSVVF
jgi:hypothetical protein